MRRCARHQTLIALSDDVATSCWGSGNPDDPACLPDPDGDAGRWCLLPPCVIGRQTLPADEVRSRHAPQSPPAPARCFLRKQHLKRATSGLLRPRRTGTRNIPAASIDYCRVRPRLTCSASTRDGGSPACRWSPRRFAGIIPFHSNPFHIPHLGQRAIDASCVCVWSQRWFLGSYSCHDM